MKCIACGGLAAYSSYFGIWLMIVSPLIKNEEPLLFFGSVFLMPGAIALWALISDKAKRNAFFEIERNLEDRIKNL